MARLSESEDISMIAVLDRFMALYRNTFGENKGDHKLSQNPFPQEVILYKPLFSMTAVAACRIVLLVESREVPFCYNEGRSGDCTKA